MWTRAKIVVDLNRDSNRAFLVCGNAPNFIRDGTWSLRITLKSTTLCACAVVTREPRNRDNGASDVWALTAYKSIFLLPCMRQSNILPTSIFNNLGFVDSSYAGIYRQLRARRALSPFKAGSVESQKGAIAIDNFVQRYSTLLVLNGTSLNIDSALLALN